MIGLFMIAVMSTSYFDSYPEESKYAVDFVTEHKIEIKSIRKHLSSEDSRLAMCIVAPEVSQYSQMSDAAETFALYSLYVQGKVLDFSIGAFQMKPSFAITIEEEIARCDYLKQYRALIIQEKSDRAVRYERVERLSSLRWQLIYLCAFIEIARKKTSNLSFKTAEEKLKYWATLYNAGLHASENKIYGLYDIDGFPKLSSKCFNYADVCMEFYRNRKYCPYF